MSSNGKPTIRWANSQDMREFPIPNSTSVLLFNDSESCPYLLQKPNDAEMNEFLRRYEQDCIDRFWKKHVVTPSASAPRARRGFAYGSTAPIGYSLFQTEHIEPIARRLGLIQGSWGSRKNITDLPLRHQDQLLEQLKPDSLSSALELFTTPGCYLLSCYDFRARLPTQNIFIRLIELASSIAVSSEISDRDSRAANASAWQVLLMMRDHFWILWPKNWVEQCFGTGTRADRRIPAGLSRLVEQLTPNSDNPRVRRIDQLRLLLRSSLRTPSELSHELIDTSRDFLSSWSPILVLRHWRRLASAREVDQDALDLATKQRMVRNHATLVFGQNLPKAVVEWCDVWTDYLQRAKTGRLGFQDSGMRYWFRYLRELKVVPTPLQVKRWHINSPDKPCYVTFLHGIKSTVGRSKGKPLVVATTNGAITVLHDLFEDVRKNAQRKRITFANPVMPALDRRRRRIRSKTYRSRIPRWVLARLAQLIVVRNEKGYRWGDAITSPDALAGSTFMTVTDYQGVRASGQPEDEKSLPWVSVFCPILPAIIFLMVKYPLRTEMVRWQDGGDFDEFILDAAKHAMVKNPHGLGGRQLGALQIGDGDVSGRQNMDLIVAVNKVAAEAQSRMEYSIPFVDEETAWVIEEVQKWQRRYGALPKLVHRPDEPGTSSRNRSQLTRQEAPELSPLFRFPARESSNASDGHFPPTHHQVRNFWDRLAAYYDTVYTDDPKLSETRRVSSNGRVRVEVKALFDLHSLRVSGVSALLDAGVPLGIVASITGHQTLVMCLYYYKANRAAIRKKLSDVCADLRKTSPDDAEQVEKILKDLPVAESWMLGNSPDAFEALRQQARTRNWNFDLSGICPGTRCSDGILDGETVMPVPGSRCALCRFRLYSPAHLPGLIQEFNCCIFTLEEYGKRHDQLVKQLESFGTATMSSAARAVQNQLERLEDQADFEISVLHRTWIMIDEALRVLNKHIGTGSEKPTLLGRDVTAVKTRVEALGELHLQHTILDGSFCLESGDSVIVNRVINSHTTAMLQRLREVGAKPYLAGLPPSVLKHCAFLFSDLLIRLSPSGAEEFMEGQLPVDSVLAEKIRKVSSELDKKLSKPNILKRIQDNIALLFRQSDRLKQQICK